MNLNKLIQLTLENGGASTSFNTGIFNPKVGYFASYIGHELVIKLEVFTLSKVKVLILPYLIQNEKLIRAYDSFIGTWIDSNLVYVDISKQFTSESECIKFAKVNKQKAYYDAVKGVVKDLRV